MRARGRNYNDALRQRFGRDKGGGRSDSNELHDGTQTTADPIRRAARIHTDLFLRWMRALTRASWRRGRHYPVLKLGPAWWFHDAPEAMLRYRRSTTETAGFYNTAGSTTTRAHSCPFPARHDLARRMDCAYLAELVATQRLEEDEAAEVAVDLAYRLPKAAYRL